MSEIWNFSPSLNGEVQKCLAAAAQDKDNKWFKKFGCAKVDYNLTNYNTENNLITDQNTTGKVSPIILSDEEDHKEGNKDEFDTNLPTNETENIEKICDYLESEFPTRLDFFLEECLKDPLILQKLASRLSTTMITKLFKYIYENNAVNLTFVTFIFKYFLTAYLKREYNCLTLDLLIQGSKLYPTEFEILIKEIAKDSDVPNKILQDYIKTLTEAEQTKFLLALESLDLSSEDFVNNLFSINTAYKGCIKTDRIQSYILSLLYEHSNSCAMDKNYGRLLLAFLQTVKSEKGNFQLDKIEKIVTSHRSAFKRPCFTIFNELTTGGEESKPDVVTDSD